MFQETSPHINSKGKTIEFFVHNNFASHVSFKGVSQVTLSGSFNNWAKDVLYLHPDDNGVWKIVIPMLPKGKYSYKFFIDNKIWTEDIENPNREPDGLVGFNSILTI